MTDGILIEKELRRLTLLRGGQADFCCTIALGKNPSGHKRQEGDGKTPEGDYFVCLKRTGKYGLSLGISYPNVRDAREGGLQRPTIDLIAERAVRFERPPWGTPLGGEIFIHGGGAAQDWTQGCIALNDSDIKHLYNQVDIGTPIRILA